jgi:uncharacterized phiE125 gp8 family phage protein
MNCKIYTLPVLEPITRPELKLHLRIGDDTTEDSLLTALITSAREHVEDITRRALLSQTWDYWLPGWPSSNEIPLPFGNLQSAGLSIKWKDSAGTETTLTVTTDYIVETNGEGIGKIVLPYGGTWPSGTLYPSNPITIRFTCGWTTAALVPYKIKAAIKMICAKMYEDRGEDVVGALVTSYSESKIADRLLASVRLWGEYP